KNSTLATRLPIEGIPSTLSIAQMAEMFDCDPKWIHDAKRRSVIEPVYSTGDHGELLFPRGSLVRLAVYDLLKGSLGERSVAPAEIVRSIAADLDQCATGPWFDLTDATRAIEVGFRKVVDALRDGLIDRLSAIAS